MPKFSEEREANIRDVIERTIKNEGELFLLATEKDDSFNCIMVIHKAKLAECLFRFLQEDQEIADYIMLSFLEEAQKSIYDTIDASKHSKH